MSLLTALALVTLAQTPTGDDEERFREAARLRSLALAEIEDGRFEQAIEHLEVLAEILPDNVLPPINLAIAHYRLGQRDQALEQLARAEAMRPNNANLLFVAASILENDPDAGSRREQILERFSTQFPRDPRPDFLRARAAEADDDSAAAAAAYERALRKDPENLALMVDLLVAAARVDDPELTEEALYSIEDRLNGFDEVSDRLARDLEETIDRRLAGSASQPGAEANEPQPSSRRQGLLPRSLMLRNTLRTNELYRLSLSSLVGRQTGLELFPQLDFDPPLPASVQGGQDLEIGFVAVAPDILAQLGNERVTGLAAMRATAEEAVALITDSGSVWRLGPPDEDASDSTLEPLGVTVPREAPLHFLDLNQDAVMDLVTLIDSDSEARLVLVEGKNQGFEPRSVAAATAAAGRLFSTELDHDGDLDLLWLNDTLTYFRTLSPELGNDGVQPTELQLGLPESTALAAVAMSDLDNDGDLDLVTATAQAVSVHRNERTGTFTPPLSLIGDLTGIEGIEAADFDLDGHFDLLVWGAFGAQWLSGPGRIQTASLEIESLSKVAWRDVAVADFDNDGDQDLAVLTADGARLLRNRRGDWTSEELFPKDLLETATSWHELDWDGDGDLDLIALSSAAANGVTLLENQGGNRNGWIELSLAGLNDSNAKNNTQGQFARIEVRVGQTLQTFEGNGGVNHIGLGAARQADVVRVVWTNGVAQFFQQVSSETTLVEEQVLKGSCPFLYTWNGREFEFHTDLMWRSTLGMTNDQGMALPHQSAKDWVLIPGDRLVPIDGEFWLQVTDELWETIYVDRQRLYVVDYPRQDRAGVAIELAVDERFSMPFPLEAPLHWLGERFAPVSAVDQEGHELAEVLARADGVRVENLPLTRYQGVTAGQSLTMRFEPGERTAEDRLRLVLSGWIMPTDSTLNAALRDNPLFGTSPPKLEVLDRSGQWRVVSANIGLPNGKNKTLVIDLDGVEVSEAELWLRLSASMQIYWDSASLVVGDPAVEKAQIHELDPVSADLHYRGFSAALPRRASEPHLFDYQTVTVDRVFQPMAGRHTRYGDARELLLASDNRYVVMSPGDELSLRYDATELPALPPGWKRDFVLHTDGWVKDADFHTRESQTVEPLPFHGMESYPDGDRQVPGGEAHRRYQAEYQTRVMGGEH